MNKLKKTLALLLSLVMILSLLPAAAFADNGVNELPAEKPDEQTEKVEGTSKPTEEALQVSELQEEEAQATEWDLTSVPENSKVAEFDSNGYVNSYSDLTSALSGMTSGNTLVMVANDDITQTIYFRTNDVEINAFTLDLNGKTISANCTLFYMYQPVNLTIKDSGEDGAIVVAGKGDIYAINSRSDGTIVLESGSLSAATTTGTTSGWTTTYGKTYVVALAGSASFVMNGGTISIPNTSNSDYNYCIYNSGSGSITINAGAVNGNGRGGNYVVGNSSSGLVTVNGGTIIGNYALGGSWGDTPFHPYTIYNTGSTSAVITGGYFLANEDGNGRSDEGLVYGKASISGGYFGDTYCGISSSKLASGYRLFNNPEPSTNGTYPYIVAESVIIWYHGNGGTLTSDSTKTSAGNYMMKGSVATAPAADTFTRADYTFTGWNTAADGTGTAYAPGDSVTMSDEVNLYAQWTAIPYVAQIDDVKYESLAAAIADVPTDGTETTITMIGDETIVGNAGVTVAVGMNIVLDLNGHTIQNAVNENTASQVITNRGNLTIQDTSDGANGVISNAIQEGTQPGEWWSTPQYNYVSNVITNNGTLTIKSGTIRQTARGSICYAVDNQSGSSDTTLNVKGGLLTDNYGTVVRMFCNSTTKENIVNVSGGKISTTGAAAIWIQLPSKDATKDMKATLNVTGGTLQGGSYAFYDYTYGNSFGATQYTLSGGTFDGDIFSYGANIDIEGGTYKGEVAIKQTKASNVSVSGGKFSDDVYTYGDNASNGFITGGIYVNAPAADYIATGYVAVGINEGENGYSDGYRYKVVEGTDVTPVAQIGNVKYTTLAGAVAAANEATEAVTITLLADCEVGTQYGPTAPLVLNNANGTLDLNDHVLTINYNMSFLIRGSNSTVKDGTIVPGVLESSKHADWCRYGLVIDSCEGVVLSKLVSNTGIAIGGDPGNYTPNAGAAKNVRMIDCTVTGLSSRFAVFAQNGSNVIIESGTYTHENGAQSGVLYATKKSDGGVGTIKVTGGQFTGTINHGDSTSNVVITGGKFTADPTAYVASGYEAVSIIDPNYNYQVGKVKATALDESETPNTGYDATYTATKTVVDEANNNAVIKAAENTVTVNLKAASEGVATNNAIDNYTAQELVDMALSKVDNDNASTVNISIDVVKEDKASDNTSVTYEVHPVATVTVVGVTGSQTFEVSNDQLSGASFTITLPVPFEANYVDVVHTHSDSGKEDTYSNVKVDVDGSNRTVTITGVTSFSEFSISVGQGPEVTDTNNAKIQYIGNGLRRRVWSNNQSVVVPHETDIRFQYLITLPEGATLNTSNDGDTFFNWKVGESANGGRKVEVSNYTPKGDNRYEANLVLNKIPQGYFTRNIATKVTVSYKYNGNDYTIELNGVPTSVERTCNAFINDTTGKVGDEWKEYGRYLLYKLDPISYAAYPVESYTLPYSS